MRSKGVRVVQHMAQLEFVLTHHPEGQFLLGTIVVDIPRTHGDGMIARCQLLKLITHYATIVAVLLGLIIVVQDNLVPCSIIQHARQVVPDAVTRSVDSVII